MNSENQNLETNLYKVFENFTPHSDDYLGALYINFFKELPHAYRVYYNAEGKLTYQDAVDSFQEIRKNIKIKIDSRKLLQNLIEASNSRKNTKITNNIFYQSKIFCYSPHEYLVLGYTNYYCQSYNFLMNITLSEDGEMANYYEEIFCDPKNIDAIFNSLKKYFAESIKEEKVEFGIAAIDAMNSIYTTWFDYNAVEVDVDKNYNDDFAPVYKKLCNLIEEDDKSGLILLYGEPGTGKSTIIKHMITKYEQKDFVFIDDQLLMNASPEKLLTYFLDSQNTIFILEDCEKALTSRDKGYNPIMSTLLNLTDGIIADVLGIKLICTFNTNLNNIDKALLRKGRLSLKYEFKKLSKEKASELLGREVTENMSLADIYYDQEENDFSKKNERKLGF